MKFILTPHQISNEALMHGRKTMWLEPKIGIFFHNKTSNTCIYEYVFIFYTNSIQLKIHPPVYDIQAYFFHNNTSNTCFMNIYISCIYIYSILITNTPPVYHIHIMECKVLNTRMFRRNGFTMMFVRVLHNDAVNEMDSFEWRDKLVSLLRGIRDSF